MRFSHFLINISSSPNRPERNFPSSVCQKGHKHMARQLSMESCWRFLWFRKRSVYPHTCLCCLQLYTLLVKRERTMSTSPMMMIVWQKSSPLSSRASTAIASSVLSLLSGTAFKMISDVIFRSQKRARASLAS